MKHNATGKTVHNEVTLHDLPRRLTRKQAHKWVATKATPRFLRHVGGDYANLREGDAPSMVHEAQSRLRN